MIPSNAITPVPVVGAFPPPEDLPYNPLLHTVLGGVALNNASQGRQVQLWTASLANDVASVASAGGGVGFSLPTPGALTVSLAFDSNMAVVLAWQTAAGSYLHYIDSLTAAYRTDHYPGTTGCRLCVDDARPFYAANSDVIFAYTDGAGLWWRQQRDRYATPRLVGATPGAVLRVGLTDANRLQFECG